MFWGRYVLIGIVYMNLEFCSAITLLQIDFRSSKQIDEVPNILQLASYYFSVSPKYTAAYHVFLHQKVYCS
jgi:hypothetical protein